MSGWISVNDRLPLQPGSTSTFEAVDVIATDGNRVTQCQFAAGNGAGKPWASWSSYNDLPSNEITHWQPLPEPPQA